MQAGFSPFPADRDAEDTDTSGRGAGVPSRRELVTGPRGRRVGWGV